MMQSHPDIAWGKRSRVILDVGCGVASFGGYLLEKDVLAMSFAPKDEHEAQVQFALERGIPAMLAVMGTKRLPFPSSVFDLVHCARCRVPWHIEGNVCVYYTLAKNFCRFVFLVQRDILSLLAGGKLLLELNRVLRPGGYFVWSATPVYRKRPEDVGIWKGRIFSNACIPSKRIVLWVVFILLFFLSFFLLCSNVQTNKVNVLGSGGD
jgi:SAM-dependent methyltransferase